MARSVSIIDYKVQQADFFLEKLGSCELDFFAAQCYADAFVSACRSITFSVQSVCRELPEFGSWYTREQEQMKSDDLCSFFNRYRTASIHIGETPVLAGAGRNGEHYFFFMPTNDIPKVPEVDVISACRDYFRTVLGLVHRMYVRFPAELDDRWHFTATHYTSRNLSIEDAEESLGYPRGWTRITGSEEELIERWRLLRYTGTSGPVIQDIFFKYLNQVVKGPDDLPA